MYKTAIIVAAGKGSRLGLRKPKGFLNIGGKPLIEHSLEALASYGIEKFVVGTGYKSEYYETYDKFDLITVKNDDYERCGSLQTLYRCRHVIDEDVLVLDSDILYEPYCIGELLKDKRPDLVLLGSMKDQLDCVYVDGNLKMSKRLNDVPGAVGILAGITKISRKTWKQVVEYAATPPAWNEHHDWAFRHTENKFEIMILKDLIFTEIDNDQQLSHAVNVVYPKI